MSLSKSLLSLCILVASSAFGENALGSWKPLCAIVPRLSHGSTCQAECVCWLGVLKACFPLLASVQVGTAGQSYQSSPVSSERIKATSLQDEYISLHDFNKFSTSLKKPYKWQEKPWEWACGRCSVQMCVCVCDCAWVCLWSCAPSWRWRKTRHGASLEFESEHYKWSLQDPSLFNPLIDDHRRKMTAAHPWQGGVCCFICLLLLHNYLVESKWWEVTHASWFKMLL